jgi:hypothetical protein
MISDHDRTHIYEILKGHGDWFSAQLIRLIEHADTNNRELLRKAFPEHVDAFEAWYHKTGVYEGKEDGGPE